MECHSTAPLNPLCLQDAFFTEPREANSGRCANPHSAPHQPKYPPLPHP